MAKTDHWYTISAIDVKPRRRSAAIAVLGDSITDGRGTTTNGQDRWTDQLSRSLLSDRRTRNLSVLNFGLGGNCILRGGNGPTAQSRYRRDLFGPRGVKYVILFEGTNDLGGSRDGVATAEQIKAVFRDIIREAHERGIKVIGATVTSAVGSFYQRAGDQRSYLEAGIPAVMFTSGITEHTNKISDTPETLDYGLLARRIDLIAAWLRAQL